MEKYTRHFHKLTESGNVVFVNTPREFIPQTVLNKDYYAESIRWAYDNAYNGHFKDSNPSKHKTMLNAFIGKLGEFCCYEFFKNLGYELDMPETFLRKKGEWDDGDLFVGGRKVQVKTTLSSSNLMLLKRNDWDEEGNYKWGKNGKDPEYGAFFLCRMGPDPKNLFPEGSTLDELLEISQNCKFDLEVCGFLTRKDIIFAIENNIFITRGKFINGKAKIREDLIYFQSGDLKNPNLIPRKMLEDAK